MEKPTINGLGTQDKVKKAVEYVLEVKKAFSVDSTVPGSVVFDLARNEFEEVKNINENTFYSYLQKLRTLPDSKVNCPGRKQGYYLLKDSQLPVPPQNDDENPPNNPPLEMVGKRRIEAQLYPVIETWLATEMGYQASDISSSRGLGRWGNPDVVGIDVTECLGNGFSVEIVSVEVKSSSDGWEQWIFEAVSHRRFANRSYFAFACSDEVDQKIPSDMRYYAELYNVGILVVSISNEVASSGQLSVFQRFSSGALTEGLKMADVEIREAYPAPYHYVQDKYKVEFLKAQKLENIKKIFSFGMTGPAV